MNVVWQFGACLLVDGDLGLSLMLHGVLRPFLSKPLLNVALKSGALLKVEWRSGPVALTNGNLEKKTKNLVVILGCRLFLGTCKEIGQPRGHSTDIM